MKGMTFNGVWKVVQTHIIMTTESLLAIQEILLNKPEYNFLMVGRFLQDLVEKLFSVLRAICSRPTPVQFKYGLRRIVLGQFFFHVRKSSYDMDDRTEAVGLEHLLKSAEKTAPCPYEEVRLPSWEEPPGTGSFADVSLFYRQCGYIISLMKKKCCSVRRASPLFSIPLTVILTLLQFSPT